MITTVLFKGDFYLGIFLPQWIIIYSVLTYVAHYIEKISKMKFLQNKSNKELRNDLWHIIEVVPAGILVYDPLTKNVVMMNSE
jgi:hypothetical protein